MAAPTLPRDVATILTVHAYHTALWGGLGLPAARALDRESFQLAELVLEADFYSETRPKLAALYRSPLADDGLQSAYDSNRLRPFLRRHYRANPSTALDLRDTLDGFKVQAFNLGGQYALDTLGLAGVFSLSDDTILDGLREDSRQSTIVDGDLSLIDTTVDELAGQLETQRESGAQLTDAIPIINAWVIGRTVIRTALIVQTESVRASRWAILSAFVGNGIGGVTFYTVGDERVCSQCRPLHSERFDIHSVLFPFRDLPGYARIPIHPRCRCFYDAVMDGWVKPAVIWTGFAVAGLLNE